MALWGNKKTFVFIKFGAKLLVLTFMVTYLISVFTGFASAAQLTNRKLTISTSAPNTSATWTFQFNAPGTTALNGIAIQVCTTATGVCTAPGTGGNWSNSGSAFGSLTYNGSSQSGWTLDNTAGYLRAKNNTSTQATSNAIVITFNTVTNPDVANQTFYGRITTYTGDDFTSALDTGVVAASTATPIQLSGYMPESLIFCTGGTISLNGGGNPDCSTATSGSLTFADFSPSATSSVTSQMAASTNADFGYAITYSGATMTSGSNTITALSSGGTSTIGSSQFGLNLVDNTTPNVGADLSPASGASNLQGKVTTNYATADTFRFNTSGDTVANSDFDGTSGPSDSQIYTVSYIVNVNGAQPVGTYTTTITYICTATF